MLNTLFNNMLQTAWEEIESLYDKPQVDQSTIQQFKALKRNQNSHTKKEGNLEHYCAFFLPYDKEKGKIYLGYHKKADDWIPPGGHIEPGETPVDAAIREMEEELKAAITADMLKAWNLSVKPINRPEKGCLTHYDVWHLVRISEQPFDYERREYHDAGWFTLAEGVAKISKNLDFAEIIKKLF